MTRCSLFCPVCRREFDWMRGYGRDIRCCCKDCHDEAEWRRAGAILGKEYTPRQPNNKVTNDRTSTTDER